MGLPSTYRQQQQPQPQPPQQQRRRRSMLGASAAGRRRRRSCGGVTLRASSLCARLSLWRSHSLLGGLARLSPPVLSGEYRSPCVLSCGFVECLSRLCLSPPKNENLGERK